MYSFFNADQIVEFLLSIGMRPFVELSFVHKQWSTLIHTLAAHGVERYGIQEVAAWFFEVWNEPDVKALGVDPLLNVGGPATARDGWIEEFLEIELPPHAVAALTVEFAPS